MNGIELAENFYIEYGAPMIHTLFPTYEKKIAVGIAGKGSECFGYDDTISQDHDFHAGFCMWLAKDDYEEIGFRLTRAYGKLPKEYKGVSLEARSFYGDHKFGVHSIEDFFEKTIGNKNIPINNNQWFCIPSYALAEAVNGKIFRDDCQEFTKLRWQLSDNMPMDVWKKKLAARLALMAQAGQYNYPRCLAHKEPEAAALAVQEFVQHTMHAIFLLRNRPMPYYKWSFRALRNLPNTNEYLQDLRILLKIEETDKGKEQETIDRICGRVIQEVIERNLAKQQGDYLEPYAFAVMNHIESAEIQALHVMYYGV